MRCLLLEELPLMKQKIKENKECWHSLTRAMRYEEYQRKSGILEKTGIDYRVWMHFIPPRPGASYRYPMQYDFYVRRRDYRRAGRMLYKYSLRRQRKASEAALTDQTK